MQQVKIFIRPENERGELEKEVNEWLADSGAKVVNLFGNIAPQSLLKVTSTGGETLGPRGYAPSDVMLVVVYEKA